MMFTLMKIGSGNDNFIMTDEKDVIMKFIYEQAEKMNYGIYRVWYIEPFTYFDCGPVTFKVNANWGPELFGEPKVEN